MQGHCKCIFGLGDEGAHASNNTHAKCEYILGNNNSWSSFCLCHSHSRRYYVYEPIFFGWTPVLGAFVVYILTKNWMSNTIIKHFSSTVKYIIYAAAMGVTYCFQLILQYRSFDLVTILCIAIIGYGVFLYSKSKRTIENIVGDTIKTFMLEARIDPKSDVDRENDDLDAMRMRMWKRAFICKRGRRWTWTAPDRMALSWSRTICSHHRI